MTVMDPKVSKWAPWPPNHTQLWLWRMNQTIALSIYITESSFFSLSLSHFHFSLNKFLIYSHGHELNVHLSHQIKHTFWFLESKLEVPIYHVHCCSLLILYCPPSLTCKPLITIYITFLPSYIYIYYISPKHVLDWMRTKVIANL